MTDRENAKIMAEFIQLNIYLNEEIKKLKSRIESKNKEIKRLKAFEEIAKTL